MISLAEPESQEKAVADWPQLGTPSSRGATSRKDTTAAWMWTALAVKGIELRYRGSVLGPFWMTVRGGSWTPRSG